MQVPDSTRIKWGDQGAPVFTEEGGETEVMDVQGEDRVQRVKSDRQKGRWRRQEIEGRAGGSPGQSRKQGSHVSW